MNRVLATLAARALLGRRRLLLMTLAALGPVVIAVLYRASWDPASGTDPAKDATEIVGAILLTLLVPVVSLVLGTGSLGADIEDGTAVFLLTKPVARWRIVGVNAAVATVATIALVAPSTFLTTWIITSAGPAGVDAPALALGLTLSAVAASVMYCCVFVALSARTSRALVIGLAYVFVWEVVATSFFGSLRWVSIREYATAWSQLAVDLPDNDTYLPSMSTWAAIVGTLVIVAGAVAYGTYALERFQVRENA